MKIYVIRHGETPMNKDGVLNGQIDEDLNEKGIQQAKRASKKIPGSVKHIYSSPMKRAHKTATLLSNSKLPIERIDGIREVSMGKHAGGTWDIFDKIYGPEAQKRHRRMNYDYSLHGGESASEVKKRVSDFFMSIKEKHNDGEVLVVTHGGVIRTIYFLHHGEPLERGIENTELFEFDIDVISSNML